MAPRTRSRAKRQEIEPLAEQTNARLVSAAPVQIIAQKATQPTGLLDLPDEILETIFRFVRFMEHPLPCMADCRRVNEPLVALAGQLCKRLQPLIENAAYGNMRITQGSLLYGWQEHMRTKRGAQRLSHLCFSARSDKWDMFGDYEPSFIEGRHLMAKAFSTGLRSAWNLSGPWKLQTFGVDLQGITFKDRSAILVHLITAKPKQVAISLGDEEFDDVSEISQEELQWRPLWLGNLAETDVLCLECRWLPKLHPSCFLPLRRFELSRCSVSTEDLFAMLGHLRVLERLELMHCDLRSGKEAEQMTAVSFPSIQYLMLFHLCGQSGALHDAFYMRLFGALIGLKVVEWNQAENYDIIDDGWRRKGNEGDEDAPVLDGRVLEWLPPSVIAIGFCRELPSHIRLLGFLLSSGKRIRYLRHCRCTKMEGVSRKDKKAYQACFPHTHITWRCGSFREAEIEEMLASS